MVVAMLKRLLGTLIDSTFSRVDLDLSSIVLFTFCRAQSEESCDLPVSRRTINRLGCASRVRLAGFCD